MKNIKLMILCGVMFGATLGASNSEDSGAFDNLPFTDAEMGWDIKYEPLNFISFPNDPTPSKVGFFNGDMKQYQDKLREVYPDGSCMQERITRQGVTQTRDMSNLQRFEHVLQDVMVQTSVGHCLDTQDFLKTKKDQAQASKDFYKMIACCGLNRFWKQSESPQLSPELLIKKVSDVRAQKYVQLKSDSQTIRHFQDSRNHAVRLMKNESGSIEDVAKHALNEAYNELSDKVLLQHQTQVLNQEKRCYQGAIAVTAVVVGVGGYLWATKK